MSTFVTLHLRKFAPWKMFCARKMHIGHFPGRTNSTGTCTTVEIHVCKYWQLDTYIHPFTWAPGGPNSTQVVQLSLEWGHSNWHRLGERKAEIKFTAKLLLNKCLQCTDSLKQAARLSALSDMAIIAFAVMSCHGWLRGQKSIVGGIKCRGRMSSADHWRGLNSPQWAQPHEQHQGDRYGCDQWAGSCLIALQYLNYTEWSFFAKLFNGQWSMSSDWCRLQSWCIGNRQFLHALPLSGLTCTWTQWSASFYAADKHLLIQAKDRSSMSSLMSQDVCRLLAAVVGTWGFWFQPILAPVRALAGCNRSVSCPIVRSSSCEATSASL